MSLAERLSVPIGGAATTRSTRPDCHRVLVVAHTVTSVTRLLDVLPVFESDFRVQLVFTRARSSHFREGVDDFLRDLGVVVAPWEQAIEEDFDLAITASLGDDLHRIKAPLVVLSHGAGYNKLGKPETGNQGSHNISSAGFPVDSDEPKAVFGLSERTLLREGRLIPSALVLSHPEQRERLRHNLDAALDSTVVAGDPTFDRILEGRAWRDEYRRALDVGRRELVLVTSTWGPGSLLGARPELLPALLRELPVDEYRVAFAAHPNAWHAHGMWQMRTWLAECERAGLAMLPPRAGWQAALVAADHVIGDHGSVTFYGAALGTHTMLATFPHEELDSASPVAEFGRSARTLVGDRSLAGQLTEDTTHHTPARFVAATDQLTSMPGASLPMLRTLCYELMGLDEPATRVRTAPPEPPEPQPLTWPARAPTSPLLVTADGDAVEVRVTRHPAELASDAALPLDRPHLVVDAAEPDSTWRGCADVLVRRDPGGTAARTWIAETLRTHPACRIAAVPTQGACLVGTRGGSVFELTREGDVDIPPDVLVSAFWRAHAERDLGDRESVKITVGTRQAVLRIARALE